MQFLLIKDNYLRIYRKIYLIRFIQFRGSEKNKLCGLQKLN